MIMNLWKSNRKSNICQIFRKTLFKVGETFRRGKSSVCRMFRAHLYDKGKPIVFFLNKYRNLENSTQHLPPPQLITFIIPIPWPWFLTKLAIQYQYSIIMAPAHLPPPVPIIPHPLCNVQPPKYSTVPGVNKEAAHLPPLPPILTPTHNKINPLPSRKFTLPTFIN